MKQLTAPMHMLSLTFKSAVQCALFSRASSFSARVIQDQDFISSFMIKPLKNSQFNESDHWMFSTVISKIKSAWGGILNPGCPWAPYAYCQGIYSLAFSPNCIDATPSSHLKLIETARWAYDIFNDANRIIPGYDAANSSFICERLWSSFSWKQKSLS